MKYLLIVYLAWSTTITSAQDFRADLQKMQQQYLQLSDFYAQIKVQIYDLEDNPTKPSETKQGEIKMQAGKVWYTIDELVLLKTATKAIMIQHDQQVLLYGNLNKFQKKKTQEIVLPDMDKVFTQYEKVVYKGIVGNSKLYHIQFKEQSGYDYAHIYLDKDLFLVRKIRYVLDNEYFSNKSKIELSFHKMTTSPSFDKDTFSETQYLQKQGKTLIPVNSVKDYSLIPVDDVLTSN